MAKRKVNQIEYEIDDPKDFLYSLFTFKEENKSYFPQNHWELRLIGLFGSMRQGKTTLINFICNFLLKIYGDEFMAYETDNVARSLEYINKKHPEMRKKVMCIIMDDALTLDGNDSRRSMSTENIEMSVDLSILAHLLAREDENKVPMAGFENGFCIVIYSIQDPMRLDAMIRRTLDISFFKSYYRYLVGEVDSASVEFIKNVTREAKLKSNYHARGYALGVTCTDDVMRFYFPRTKYNLPIIFSEAPDYSQIIDELVKLELSKIKDVILKGFIQELCDSKKIKLKKSMYSELIQKARYTRWKNGFDAGEEEDDEEIDEDDSEFIANTKKRRSKVSKLQDKNKELTETLKAQNSELKKIKSELKAKEDQEKIIQKQKAKKERQEMIAEKISSSHNAKK